MRHLSTTSLVLAASGLALAACSYPSHNAALDQAHSSYSSASADPAVSRFGAYPLAEANENLQVAQAAFSNQEAPTKVTHYATLANTQTEIAASMAKRRQASQEVVATTREMTLGDMNFRVGKADLNSQGISAAGEIATFMKNHPTSNVVLNGYTDSTGSLQLNQKLSLNRAKSVQAALIQDSIDAQRITIQGHGPSDPVASNGTAEGRSKNRRVVAALTPTVEGVGSSQPTQ
jgi:outer membrane protein OmpA-like peptidoglycan-associated protein